MNTHPLSLEKEILYGDRTDSTPDVTKSEIEDESSSELPESFLYDGSSLTVRNSSILILKFKMRHNLTDELVSNVLHFFKLHCPAPNCCLSSLYHFKKQFYDMQYPIAVSHFCSCCLNELTLMIELNKRTVLIHHVRAHFQILIQYWRSLKWQLICN